MITMDDKNNDGGTRNLAFDDSKAATADIKVVGIGGGGGNAINRMVAARVDGVHFIAANTDCQALRTSAAGIKLQLGAKLTKGLGAGGNPEVGRSAALEDTEKVVESAVSAAMVSAGTASAKNGASRKFSTRIPSKPASCNVRASRAARSSAASIDPSHRGAPGRGSR